MHEYAKDYRKQLTNSGDWKDFKDEWYALLNDLKPIMDYEGITEEQRQLKNGCGLTYYEYEEQYKKMLKSVYTHGGFWIGRYEAGDIASTQNNTNRIHWIRKERWS